jgi:hypothetical protein
MCIGNNHVWNDFSNYCFGRAIRNYWGIPIQIKPLITLKPNNAIFEFKIGFEKIKFLIKFPQIKLNSLWGNSSCKLV